MRGYTCISSACQSRIQVRHDLIRATSLSKVHNVLVFEMFVKLFRQSDCKQILEKEFYLLADFFGNKDRDYFLTTRVETKKINN